jgi:hypothetical protein
MLLTLLQNTGAAPPPPPPPPEVRADYRGRRGRPLKPGFPAQDSYDVHLAIHDLHEAKARALEVRREQGVDGERVVPVGDAIGAVRAAREAGAPLVVRDRKTGAEVAIDVASDADDDSTLLAVLAMAAVALDDFL